MNCVEVAIVRSMIMIMIVIVIVTVCFVAIIFVNSVGSSSFLAAYDVPVVAAL